MLTQIQTPTVPANLDSDIELAYSDEVSLLHYVSEDSDLYNHEYSEVIQSETDTSSSYYYYEYYS